MSIVLELVAQIVFELLFEWVARLGWSGAQAIWRSTLGRVTAYAGAGAAFGIWWGQRLDGRPEWPAMLWTSLALAGVALLAALHRWTRDRESAITEPDRPEGLWPWRWSTTQWGAAAALNLGIVAGIAAAFDSA